jgi:ribonucleoside-diphosphate reductase alpha chain
MMNNKWTHLTEFGKKMLKSKYVLPNESFEELGERVIKANVKDKDRQERLKNALFNGWFVPATPVLSNSGTERGLPISCFNTKTPDSKEGIFGGYSEDMWLGSAGGGIGRDWSDVREVGSMICNVGESGGIVPFLKISDSITNGISQGALRRASEATYLEIDHPEIEEFIDIRRNTGASIHRRCIHIHHGVIITDKFMNAVINDESWDLISRKDGSVVKTLKAYDLFTTILEARIEKGEPYLFFKDTANRYAPELYKLENMTIYSSNLCSELMQATDYDYTAVCCLSSVNLETYDEWKDNYQFIEDLFYFLDGVLRQFEGKVKAFPEVVQEHYQKALKSVSFENSVGLGVMGWHGLLQKRSIPFESSLASGLGENIFSWLREAADMTSYNIAKDLGPCQLAKKHGKMERFTLKLMIAPTGSISIIGGDATAGIDPRLSNGYVHNNDVGKTTIKNPYLQEIMDKYARDNGLDGRWIVGQWKSIIANDGSVQHLDWLNDWQKDVFKTAYELDQRWIIEHVSIRQKYIDQGQSVNLFIPHDVSKSDLLGIHLYAWKRELKALYYCRSTAPQRARVGHAIEREVIEESKYEECLSCT